MAEFNGFINLHKAPDYTSHDCVAKVRRLLNTKKVGHGGTLDPAATGVLPIAVGRATRLLQFLPTDKAYRAVIRFGVTTDTDDLAGDVLSQRAVPDLTQAAILTVLPNFIGDLQQLPPMYSAVQVQGKRLYSLARQGEVVADLPRRSVTVYQIEPCHWQPGDFPELTLNIACGSGTYIRSIARDLGEQLGTGATLATLRRTHSSGFNLDQSLTLETLGERLSNQSFQLISPEQALHHLPTVTLALADGQRWCLGQKLPATTEMTQQTALYVRDDTHRFLGIGLVKMSEDASMALLTPKVVFPPSAQG